MATSEEVLAREIMAGKLYVVVKERNLGALNFSFPDKFGQYLVVTKGTILLAIGTFYDTGSTAGQRQLKGVEGCLFLNRDKIIWTPIWEAEASLRLVGSCEEE